MTAAAVAPAGAERVDRRRMITFVCMVFGMFMAILDIQIVSASLADIQAGIGASSDEISWVQTSYLIAEVVMIPLSGLLSRMLSTRWLFTASAAGFTFASLMCGLSDSIGEMIFWRAAQGFVGGAMIPTVFASAFIVFPPSKRHIVSPIIGLVATLAPTLGPTIGGYLSDLLSWHWLFFVNIVPGIAVTIAAWSLIDFDRPNLKLFDDFDWFGLAAMAIFLGSVEFVLEEGPTHDWFADEAVLLLTLAAIFGGLAFFWRALTAKQPIVSLAAFSNRNFAAGSLFSFVLGIGLYGLTYLYPIFLGRIRGYSSLQIGETMFLTGVCMFVTAPIAGRLAMKLDPRVIIGLGFGSLAVSNWLASVITPDWGFHELIWPQIFRGAGLMMCMVAINNVALGSLPQDMIKNASGLFNLTRNLGGAVGLAVINTVLNGRWDQHIARLHEQVSWGRPAAEQTLAGLAERFAGGGDPDAMALKVVAGMARSQALVLSFADMFLLLTLLFAGLLVLLPFIRRPGAVAGGSGH